LLPYPANKKVGRLLSSDFRALDEPANFTVLGDSLNFRTQTVKRKQTALIQAKCAWEMKNWQQIKAAPAREA